DDLSGDEAIPEKLDDFDDLSDAEAALSVPPPLLSPQLLRRGAIAGGALILAVAVWAGVGAVRSRGRSSPAPSASAAVAGSADPPSPLPAASAEDDTDGIDDLLNLPPVDAAKALALRNEARAMLEAGRIDEGVATARRAVAANPNDPVTYVLLAAGLQDQGKWE